tara:strand:- start:89 stop:1282 length:1194 start_codon:yes stop_codon:yes gene_type:complete
MYSFNNFLNLSIEKFAINFFNKTKYGNLFVEFPSKNILNFKGTNDGVDAEIKLNNFLLIKKIATKGALGFAESYMDGDFTTKNLKDLLIFAERNKSIFLSFTKEKVFYKIFARIKNYFNQNTISKARKNIEYHYDLGNKFYELWLDETMTYSSGYFKESNDDLLTSQINKFKKIIEPMEINEKSSILEIGCGWGGFSTFVAKNFNAKIDAITISKEQYEYTSRKIMEEGLNEKINLRLEDYRNINNNYDNIVSIEMFEAVGKKYWPIYFKKIKENLKINGKAVFQIITINEHKKDLYQKNPDFIQEYIFPGGVLPSKRQLHDMTSALGLQFYELSSFGNSYANTLNLWNKQFQQKWSQISRQGYTKRFKRMWEYYFSYCEAGFLTKSTDVSQFLLKV